MLKINVIYFNLLIFWWWNFLVDIGIFFVVVYVLYYVYLKLVLKGEKI